MTAKACIDRETDILVVGVGFSGLYLSHVLREQGYDEFLLIGPNTNTPSDKSYYQFRSRGMRQDSLRKTVLDSGRNENNHQLVSVLVRNIDDELTRLGKIVSLKPSFVGVTPVNPRAFLGTLREESHGNRVIGEIVSAKKRKGRIVVETTGGMISCRRLVFCTGGIRSRFSSAFRDERVSHDPFGIARKLSCRVKHLDRVMIHPFYSRGVCIPTDTLFGYSVVGTDGTMLSETNDLIASHNAHFHFREILDEMKRIGEPCFAVKGSARIPLHPTAHYVLGGIVIDKNGKTNIKNVYALGECSYGMHGAERVGGASLSEIIVMARVIGEALAKKSEP
jgi:aspartate oxidase